MNLIKNLQMYNKKIQKCNNNKANNSSKIIKILNNLFKLEQNNC